MDEAVSDGQVAAFIPLVESSARRHQWRVGAEYDDLRQEGMIAVWLAFRRGQAPTQDIIENRMIDWCRRVARQQRLETDRYDEDALYASAEE